MTTAPVLDEDALGRRAEEIGDISLLCAFLRTYAASLGPRVTRLHRALLAHDGDGWSDAVLSLKSSSAMACATALANLAVDLQAEVGVQDTGPSDWPGDERVAEIMATLEALAAETLRRLRRFLERGVGTVLPDA